jgi:hypothetical protein
MAGLLAALAFFTHHTPLSDLCSHSEPATELRLSILLALIDEPVLAGRHLRGTRFQLGAAGRNLVSQLEVPGKGHWP